MNKYLTFDRAQQLFPKAFASLRSFDDKAFYVNDTGSLFCKLYVSDKDRWNEYAWCEVNERWFNVKDIH